MVSQNIRASRHGGCRHLYAGIDLGTSKVGVSIISPSGHSIWAAALELPRSRRSTRTGLLVQSPTDWLEHMSQLFHAARACLDTSAIQAIAVTATTPTTVFLRRDGTLLLDEAVMWNDPNRFGASDSSGRNAGLRKLAAISRIAPDLLREATFLVDASDYLAYRLTGSLTTGTAFLSQKMLWSPASGFDTRLFCVNDPCQILARFPERMVRTGEVVGSASGPLADVFHLRQGTPVVHAAFDSVASMIGAGVYAPSETLLVSVGTSVVFYMVPFPASGEFGPWVPRHHLLPEGQYVITGGFEAGLQSIRLLHERLRLTCKAQAENHDLERMAAQGELSEPASTFALPFGGVQLRAPLPEVVLPTAIYANTHLPSDQTMLVAMRRGVAYFVRYAMEDLRRRGIRASEIRVVGGGTKSVSFCQLLADACGVQLRRLSGNAAAAGAALLAAGSQTNATERAALINNSCGRGQEMMMPAMSRRSFYDEGFETFSQCLRAALRSSGQVPEMLPEYLI